jgi:hypothetical protein
MFKCEPSRYMTKPRYLIAMRRVYGFQIAATEEASDRATAFLLERCYNAFDYNNRYVCVCVFVSFLSTIYIMNVIELNSTQSLYHFFMRSILHTTFYIFFFIIITIIIYYHYYYLLLLLSLFITIIIYYYLSFPSIKKGRV